jgi:hypothetical protein
MDHTNPTKVHTTPSDSTQSDASVPISLPLSGLHAHLGHSRDDSHGTPGIAPHLLQPRGFLLRDLSAYDQGIYTYTEEKMTESVRIVSNS